MHAINHKIKCSAWWIKKINKMKNDWLLNTTWMHSLSMMHNKQCHRNRESVLMSHFYQNSVKQAPVLLCASTASAMLHCGQAYHNTQNKICVYIYMSALITEGLDAFDIKCGKGMYRRYWSFPSYKIFGVKQQKYIKLCFMKSKLQQDNIFRENMARNLHCLFDLCQLAQNFSRFTGLQFLFSKWTKETSNRNSKSFRMIFQHKRNWRWNVFFKCNVEALVLVCQCDVTDIKVYILTVFGPLW